MVTFQAHRVVLAASSEYFDAMFSVGLEESHKGHVALPSVLPDILTKIIDFIYTGKLSNCYYTSYLFSSCFIHIVRPRTQSKL